MQIKEFLPGLQNWVCLYDVIMSKYNKSLTAKAFWILRNKNQEYVILIATNIYGIGIDYPDIKFVIQWDILVSFDAMIQQMDYVERKSQKTVFIFLSPSWNRIADSKEWKS